MLILDGLEIDKDKSRHDLQTGADLTGLIYGQSLIHLQCGRYINTICSPNIKNEPGLIITKPHGSCFNSNRIYVNLY